MEKVEVKRGECGERRWNRFSEGGGFSGEGSRGKKGLM